MKKFRELKQIEEFIKSITSYKGFVGDLIEVVIDFTAANYFSSTDDPSELISFAIKMADSGHQVFFGPANRAQNLGAERSGNDNVASFKCLWMDIDSPDKTLPADQRLAESKKLLDEFLAKLKGYGIEPSYIIESGHGYHAYFVLTKFYLHPSDEWQQTQNALVEMAKSDPKVKHPCALLRVPGTFNYKDPSNPKPVCIVHASERQYDLADFRKLVSDFGPKRLPKGVSNPTGSGRLGFIPPCIASLLDPQNKPPLGHRHHVRQILSTYAFHEGWPVSEAIEKIMHTTDDPKKAEADVEGVYGVLERDPARYSNGCGDGSSLRTLINAGIAKCDESSCGFKKPQAPENQKKEKLSAWFDGLVDLVLDDNGKVMFLVKEAGTLVLKDKHELPDKILLPPPRDKLLWLLPRATEVLKHCSIDTDAQLFLDLVNYHRSISDMPSEDHYRFLATWVMHTYCYDQVQYSPIIWLYAIAERGKSRTGKGCIYAAFRGVHVITLNEAHIIRLATDHKATLFIDVMDLWKQVERSSSEDLILCRFESGVRMPKVLRPDLGAFNDTEYYDIYGPTIIATNEDIHRILQTRAVQVVMPEALRNFNDSVLPEAGLIMRERLVAFRARLMNTKLPEADKPARGRLGDILKPLRQIVKYVSKDESWFLRLTENIENMRKEEGADSIEARVVSAILGCSSEVTNGHLFHETILQVLNREIPDRYHISANKLGKVTARLGFGKYSSGDRRGIYWNQELLDRLCNRYGIRPAGTILAI